MILSWNSPNYFLLKTKNTQNTLTTIYITYLTQHLPNISLAIQKIVKNSHDDNKMCLNTRSNNVHNTDRHVIKKTLLLDLFSEKKNG